MKKQLLIAMVVCGFSCGYSSEPEKTEVLSSKVILESRDGYFALSDGSCWKAVAFSKRWRSPREWWNNVQLIPERYECAPDDWYLGTQIEVYSKYENLEIEQCNASNEADLKQCTHLLVNTRTGQVLFAIALEPAECIVNLFEDAKATGYKKGFAEGVQSSSKNNRETYQLGYDAGYQKGYAEALNKLTENQRSGNQ